MGTNSGCGHTDAGLFSNGGAATGGAGISSGGSSPATGGAVTSGASPSTGGSSLGTGGAGGSTGSGGTPAGGHGSAGDGDSGGSPGAGGSPTSGGTTAGGSSSGGSGGSGPTLQTGSVTVAAFEGLHCESVTFKTAFTAAASDLVIQASAVHPDSTQNHGALAIWVRSLSATGFDVCMTEDTGLNGSHLQFRLDWVAALAQSLPSQSAAAGRFALGAVSGRSCQVVSFPTVLAAESQLQITANRQGAASAPNDPLSVWVEEVSAQSFRVCAEELEGTDGALDGTNVDWLAYPGTFADQGFSAGERNLAAFSGLECVEIETGCENCENLQLSVNHRRRTEGATAAHAATLVWAEDMTADGVLTACVRNTSAYGAGHDGHLSIDWLARQKND